MTQVGTEVTGANSKSSLWVLINPATGSNTVSMSFSGAVYKQGIAASYTGAKQSAQPDSNNSGGPTTTNSFSISTTTIADNCWLVMAGTNDNGNTVSGGTGTTGRQSDPNGFGWLADSNAAKTPAGSYSLNVTCTSQPMQGQILSIAPLVNTVIKAISATVSVAASRLSTLARIQTAKRAAAATVSVAASRLATLVRVKIFGRSASVTVSNAASRLATIIFKKIFHVDNRNTSTLTSDSRSANATSSIDSRHTSTFTNDIRHT